jgi:hypothetical protein
MKNLVRLSKVNDHPDIPLKASTLYKWRHVKKYPGLFVKVGGAVFVDLNELGKIVEAGRG